MPKPEPRWLTAQETASILDSTSAEVCRLLKIGRLDGVKRKQPGRAGNHWLEWFYRCKRKWKRRSRSHRAD